MAGRTLRRIERDSRNRACCGERIFLKLHLRRLVARRRDLSLSRFLLQARSNGVIMSRNWTLLPLILFLGSTGTLQAQPLDSPGVVYIDGQPCSRACQAYMNWSYRALSARRHEEREIIVAVPAEAEIERVEPVARPRAAKHAAPVARPAPHAGKAASNGKAPDAKASTSKKIAAPNPAPQAPAKAMPPATAAVTPEKAAGETVAAIQKPEPKVESAPAEPAQTAAIAAPQPAEAPASKVAGTRGQARGEGRGRLAATGDARYCRRARCAHSRYGVPARPGRSERPHPHRPMIRTIWSRSCWRAPRSIRCPT